MELYSNPIARDGDFADPFVLRHDGRYYLYCTNPDLRCWSSDDLVTWRPEGPSIAPDVFEGLVPFAPEVVYDNGRFLLYTSPSGHGHFVLASPSPTGPFEPISGNVGHSIDGNVLVDLDGRRYFYWAGDEGIWGCELDGAAGFGEPVLTGIHMNGWTEGPFVYRHGDHYLMTLTGNHYLSAGYRIDAAHSAHPLHGWRPDPLNPILVRTEGEIVGLGHSSSVVGPDLVSTWMAYHNLNPDASRDLDLDRQLHNGASVLVLGPSIIAVAPAPPDIAVDWTADRDVAAWAVSGGELVAESGAGMLSPRGATAEWGVETGPEFTAELCLTGAVLTIDAAALALPPDLDPAVLHTWRVVAAPGAAVTVDGRAVAAPGLRAGARLGVAALGERARIGHCALTRTTPESADRAAVKPVPGRFWAALGEDGDVRVDRVGDGASPKTIVLTEAASIRYSVLAAEPGTHRVHLSGSFRRGDRIAVDVDARRHVLEIAEDQTIVGASVELPTGIASLELVGLHGSPSIALVTITAWAEASPSLEPIGEISLRATGKSLVASPILDDADLTARLRVEFLDDDSHADLLVRAAEPAEGGEGDDPVLGFDFLIGYSVQLHRDRVVLARHDYNERVLAEHALEHSPESCTVTVRALGGRITVELDGRRILDVLDDLPHVVGRVGMRTWNAHLRVENLLIASGGRTPNG